MKYFKRILKHYLTMACSDHEKRTDSQEWRRECVPEIVNAVDDLEEYIKEQVKVQVLLHERIYHDG